MRSTLPQRTALVFALLITAISASAQFSPRKIISPSVSTDTTAIAMADMDGDGDQDAIVGGRVLPRLEWLRNDGQGNFIPGRTLESGEKIADVVPADLDADGDVDLVASIARSNVLHIFLNLGSGLFGAAPIVLQVGAPSEDLTVQTLVGDAVPDIVVAQRSLSRVAAFTGSGNGNFSSTATVLASGAAYERCVFADLNADAQQDLVLAMNTPAPAIERRLYSGGTFGAASPIPVANFTISEVFAKDADGDNDVDVCSANSTGLALSRNSAGVFGAPDQFIIAVSNGTGTYRPALFEDLDGDGDHDAFLAVDLVPSLFTNNGAGQFTLACSRALMGTAPTGLLAAQVIPGGLPEIVLAYRATGDVEWLARTAAEFPLGSASSVFRHELIPSAPALLDYDTDGDLDHVFSGNGGLMAMRYDGAGTWQGPVVITRGFASNVTYKTALDLDADGVKEIVVINNTNCQVLYRASDGKYILRQSFFCSNYATCPPYLADMDNDGDQDILLNTYGVARWYRNDGNGALTSMPSFITTSVSFYGEFSSLGVADLDGDGDKDVLTTNNEGLYWSPCTAPGVFPNARTLINATQSTYVLADMDGDNDIDIVPTTSGGNWLRNSGTGTFTTAGSPTGFATDIDADGDLDVVQTSGSSLTRYQNNGAGVFGLLATLPISVGATLIRLREDADRDGDLDILLTNVAQPGVFRYLPNNGGGNFGAELASPYERSGYVRELKVVDVDEDGLTDLFVRYDGVLTGDAVGWYRKTAGGWAAFQTIEQAANGGTRLVDLDLDGKLDILTRSGAVISWRRNLVGASFAAASSLTGLSALGETQTFADLNSDGFVDLVAVSGVTVSMQFASAFGVFGAAQTLCSNACLGSNVTPVVTDLDGDGDADIAGSFGSNWYKNVGANTFSAVAFTAYAGNQTRSFGHDMDHDGHADVVSGSSFGLIWSSVNVTGVESAGQPVQGLTTNVLGDVNGDGVKEGFQGGWLYKEVSVGSFAQLMELPYLPLFTQRVDADLDGVLEYIVLNAGRLEYLEGSAVPMASTTKTVTTQMSNSAFAYTAPCVAEFNGDGRKDIIYCSGSGVRCFLSDGNGGFSTPTTVGLGGNGNRSFSTGDVNGDGKTDVLAVLGQQMGVYVNQGAGLFSEIRMWTYTGNGGGPGGGDLADLTGDGRPDMVHLELPNGGISPNRMYLRVNNGGGFQTSQLFTSTYLSGLAYMNLEDMDGDGDRDIVFADGTTIKRMENLGGGTFAAPVVLVSSFNNEVVVADVNADGRLDIVYESSAGAQLAINNGSWSFAVAQQLVAGLHSHIDLCDMDLDGDQDLLLMNADLTEVGWNNGAGQFTVQPLLSDGGAHVTPIDLDGDGDIDLVCSNNSPQPTLYWYENLAGSPMVVSGRVFRDVNANGAYDNGEPGVANVAVTEQPSGAVSITNLAGQYSFNLPGGTHKLQVPDSALFTSSTTGGWTRYATISTGAPLSQSNNFGVQRPDSMLGAVCVHLSGHRCSAQTTFRAMVRNNGTTPFNGVLRVKLASNITVTGYAQTPDSVTANGAYWTITNLQPNAQILVSGNVTLPGGQGTAMPIESAIRVSSVQFPTAVTFQEAYQVTTDCSFDPNAKSVTPEGTGPTGNVPPSTSTFTYTVHFQNIGNAPAFNIVVRDRLNVAVDRTSVRVVAASHEPTVMVEGDGELVFRFTGINLPDSLSDPLGSQGYVTFAVDLLPGQPVGTVITNTADIYFDQNSPITTNETVNRLHGGFAQVSPRFLLQGPFDPVAHLMRDNLRTRGVIPPAEPYTALGFTGITPAQVAMDPQLWNRTGANAVVDWVLVELRSTVNPVNVVATRAALVQRDGDVVDVDGNTAIWFPVAAGNYRLAVRHRTHLGAMSGATYNLGLSSTAIDLSVPAATFYGTQAVASTTDSRRALWAGDVRADGVLKYAGVNNDRDPILVAIGSVAPTNTVSNVYAREDVNMDGVIRYVGANNDRDPILTNVGSTSPNSTRTQQLP